MKNFWITTNEYQRPWPAHSHHIKKMLGLTPEQKLPSEGMPPRIIQGIKIWVNPLNPNRKSARQHRVVFECPDCKRVMSVGRMHQHSC